MPVSTLGDMIISLKTSGICLVAFALAAPLRLSADPGSGFPFRLDPLLDGGLVAGGLVVYGAGLYLDGLKPAPTKAAADAALIPFFDRAYPAAPSGLLSTLGNDMAIGAAVLPVALAYGRTGGEIADLGVMYFETLELAYASDSILKSVVSRYRPYSYSASVPADFSNPDITASFPSSHASLAFSSAVFGAYVFGELYPASPARPWVWGAGLGLAAAVSSLRVLSADHFVSDVVVGVAIGAASGFLVPLLHERRAAAGSGSEPAPLSVGLAPSRGGIGLVLDFRP